MKKLTFFFFALLLTFSTFQIQAQSFKKGDKIVQAGLSLGAFGARYMSAGFSMPLNASLEVGIHKYFSVGPYAGFNRWRYREIGSNFGVTYVAAGARGSFHYLPFLNNLLDASIDEEKFDFYTSVLLGLTFASVHLGEGSDYHDRATGLAFGPLLGFRYKINNQVGTYVETGRGALGLLTVGASLHF